MYNPLEQFKVTWMFDLSYPLFDLSLSIISILFIILWLYVIVIISKLKYLNKLNFIIISILHLFYKEFINILGIKNSNYLPFILFIFIYTLFSNLLGLIPYTFTLTSQISITILWSLTVMITVTYLGIRKYKFNFINLFIPNGVPKFLLLYILIIELISYLSRVLSLAIRLTTNMIAGHVLIYILCFFAYKLNIKGLLLLPALLAILILEIGVSVIQAYVLSVLISTYIKDCLELGH